MFAKVLSDVLAAGTCTKWTSVVANVLTGLLPCKAAQMGYGPDIRADLHFGCFATTAIYGIKCQL